MKIFIFFRYRIRKVRPLKSEEQEEEEEKKEKEAHFVYSLHPDITTMGD